MLGGQPWLVVLVVGRAGWLLACIPLKGIVPSGAGTRVAACWVVTAVAQVVGVEVGVVVALARMGGTLARGYRVWGVAVAGCLLLVRNISGPRGGIQAGA